MRVHHYIKNILVFVPLACSGELFDHKKLLSAAAAFFAFCFIASAVYFINDLVDAEKDRKHHIKCKRPIASGDIPKRAAIIFTVFLISLSMLFNYFCFNLTAFFLLILYFALNICYSSFLKNKPIIDIAILVSGFLIRALYGSKVTDIRLSNWLYLVILSGAFYMVLGKRRNEFKSHQNGETREVISKYPFSFLETNMHVFMTLIFVFYALWTVDQKTIVVYHTNNLIWTVPLIILIFMKYSLIIEGDSDGDPVDVLIHDKVLVFMCLLYLTIMFVMLYVLR